MQLLGLTLPKIPKVLCYRFYLLLKKIIAILSMSDFKFNLFHTRVSSSLCSLNQGLHLLYRKKICHSLTMKCCTGNNLISSVFKTEMPWGKPVQSFRSAESQRYSTSYSDKYGKGQGWSPQLVAEVMETQNIFQNNLMLPQKERCRPP